MVITEDRGLRTPWTELKETGRKKKEKEERKKKKEKKEKGGSPRMGHLARFRSIKPPVWSDRTTQKIQVLVLFDSGLGPQHH